jgi:hypothetical protein
LTLGTIDDYQNSNTCGVIHRFWIQAETVNFIVTEIDDKENDFERIAIGKLKMVVKKHKMIRDIFGNLKDISNDDEGWPIYVLSESEIAKFLQRKRIISDKAMVFIDGTLALHFWKNNTSIKLHIPSDDLEETLIRLYQQPRNTDGRIMPDLNNQALLYRVTKSLAEEAAMPHHFSAEYTFAHEFSTHYDEFAHFMPEFRRLKELSKMTALIRKLDEKRSGVLEQIGALNAVINDSRDLVIKETSSYKHFQAAKKKIVESIASQFDEWIKSFANSTLQSEFKEILLNIQKDFGTLTFSSHSSEVTEYLNKHCRDLMAINPGVSRDRIWNELVWPKRFEIANSFASSKRSSCKKQLIDLFKPMLYPEIGLNVIEQKAESFLNGDLTPLADALATAKRKKAINDIGNNYKCSSTNDIILALNGNRIILDQIASAEANQQLNRVRSSKEPLANGFDKIDFGCEEKVSANDARCHWIPACINHKVKIVESANRRESQTFFVYGGVNINPNINIVRGGNNGPLGGTPVGGGGFNRNDITRGFQSHHIISDTNKATMHHPLLELAGVSFSQLQNGQFNRIYLPKYESGHPTRSIHNGRHLPTSMDILAKRMTDAVNQGRRENWS